MLLVLKNVLFTVVVPGTVAVYVPLLLAPSRSLSSNAMFVLAIALFALGGPIYAWCVWDFAAFGGGTPAPFDAPKRLVIRGLYRYTRNPMYLGVLLIVLAWAALFETAILAAYALFVAFCFHLFIVRYEERHLHRAFGRAYSDYCVQVGRWFPRLPRRPAAEPRLRSRN